MKPLLKWLDDSTLLKSSLAVIVSSLIASTLTVAVRQLGGFESFSLKTYDWLVQLRPEQEKDDRILTVLITEADIQSEGQWPISDRTLAEALNILLASNPAGIGIDLYRDLPVEPGSKDLTEIFTNSDRISVVCKLESTNAPAVSPPDSLPEQLVGFADIVIDNDGVARRNLFYVDSQETRCPTPYSLGLQMSLSYLFNQGIDIDQTPDGFLKLGKAVLTPINSNIGNYQNVDASGYQMMLDYRRGENPTPTVTLNDVLQGKIEENLIQEKVVLIGVSAPSLKDVFYTPFSNRGGDIRLMPGVVVHSQMVSQVLSASIDGEQLIWSWSEAGEIGWIYLWGLLGSVSVIWIARPTLMIAGQVYGSEFNCR